MLPKCNFNGCLSFQNVEGNLIQRLAAKRTWGRKKRETLF